MERQRLSQEWVRATTQRRAFTGVTLGPGFLASAAQVKREAEFRGKARGSSSSKPLSRQRCCGCRQLHTIAPGWDRQALVTRYHQWSKGKSAPNNPHGAFIAWVKRFTKGKAPS
jgi:hypothetical protein